MWFGYKPQIIFCHFFLKLNLGLFQKKIPGRGRQGDIFFYGWLVRKVFKLYGSLVFDQI